MASRGVERTVHAKAIELPFAHTRNARDVRKIRAALHGDERARSTESSRLERHSSTPVACRECRAKCAPLRWCERGAERRTIVCLSSCARSIALSGADRASPRETRSPRRVWIALLTKSALTVLLPSIASCAVHRRFGAVLHEPLQRTQHRRRRIARYMIRPRMLYAMQRQLCDGWGRWGREQPAGSTAGGRAAYPDPAVRAGAVVRRREASVAEQRLRVRSDARRC